MTEPTELTCQCCGIKETIDPEEAFRIGWDAPPHFSQIITCPLCPSACAFGLDHSKAHEGWEKEGRPKTFEEQLVNGDLPPLQ